MSELLNIKEHLIGKVIRDVTMTEQGYFEFRSDNDEVLFRVDNGRVLAKDGNIFEGRGVEVRRSA